MRAIVTSKAAASLQAEQKLRSRLEFLTWLCYEIITQMYPVYFVDSP